MNATPEDKRDVPLGSDDNPIPLVKFTNLFKKLSKKGKSLKKKEAGKMQRRKSRK